MPNELTDKIRNALRIEDVIGRTVRLRRTHRGWIGLCPFHNDNSPSFHVYTDTQHYYCYGCHEAGDIFTFVMKTQNLTFPEAVSVLAEEAGIKLEDSGSRPGGKNLYDVMKMAQEYFVSCFARLPAGRAYLESRGISSENAESAGLGYAPDSWGGLMTDLKRRGVDVRMMLDAGLVIQGGRGAYDRFRGRVMFPVRDVAGRIIAFGGRAIVPNVGAKYINSPESGIYSKRKNLYLMDKAGSVIREKGYSILCEGYMDALRLHMSGFRESVASLGTSLTHEQAGLLKRFADRCYICYDGDPAGMKAALRGMYILAGDDIDVRVVRLPDGKDPDDFLRENPPGTFQKALDDALPLVQYHVEMLRPELGDPDRRKKAVRDLLDGVRSLTPYYALQSTASLSEALKLLPEEVVKLVLSRETPSEEQPPSPQPGNPADDDELECAFCASLARWQECRLMTDPGEISGLIMNPEARLVAEAIITDGPENSLSMWRTIGDTGKIGIISRGEIFIDGLGKLQGREVWKIVHSGLERTRILRRLAEIDAEMKANAATAEDMREFTELHRRLQELMTEL